MRHSSATVHPWRLGTHFFFWLINLQLLAAMRDKQHAITSTGMADFARSINCKTKHNSRKSYRLCALVKTY